MNVPVQTIEQFAAKRGLITTADVDSHIHAGLRSKPTTKTYQRWYDRELARLQSARDETVALYRASIASGAIREPSSIERLVAASNGHPDNRSTQAAQRILAKIAARQAEPAVDLTPIGPQYVIPGCERDNDRGPAQLPLF